MRDTSRPRDADQLDILFVISSLGIGGTERHVANVSAALKLRGWSVAVYCLAGPGPTGEVLRASSVELLYPPMGRTHGGEFAQRRMFSFILAITHLSLVMMRRRPHIVHFFSPAAYLVGAPLAWLARIPIRIMSRRSLSNYQDKYRFYRSLERKLHRTMTVVLGNSLAVVRQLSAEGVSRKRLGLIYNGLLESMDETPADRALQRERPGFSAGALTLIIVANLIPYKGHADLIQALALSKSRMPANWRLLIVGRDDGIQSQLQQQIEAAALADHVYFLGSRRDLPALLELSDIGLLVSHQEGFSNAVLENMAVGLPMIVTDVGGNAEAVRHNETGLVVPANDPEQLAEAIVRLSSDPMARARFGEAGRHRVQDHFSFTMCVDNYERLYRALLRGEVLQQIEGVAILDTI